MHHQELRPFWNRLFTYNWHFGILLIALVCIPRFMLVLDANETGRYQFIGFVMMVSALIPFIFLNRQGLRHMGLIATKKYLWLLLSFAFGVIGAVVLHVIGLLLFGESMEHWFVYIGQSYQIPLGLSPTDKFILFVAMALVGMTFSPIGEEFFFRGIVHQSLSRPFGHTNASYIDSLAFAITHLAHFGLVFNQGRWSFFAAPAMIWVSSMFFVSRLFFLMKKKTHSLWGAVLCHAGFNLGMIYCIFYWL